MFQIMLISISLIISYLFMNMKHPLAMGLMLLIQTFFICLISGETSKTYWFSYILFLIFLGGMMVLFIYMTSLASNEMFSINMKLMIIPFILIMLITFIMMMIDPMLFTSSIYNTEMNKITDMINFTKENSLILKKLYNFPTNMITLLMINYLFLTLIIIVKITNKFVGPLRNNH